MSQIRNVEWLTQNMNRNYPIKEGASRAASLSRRLPNEFIADLLLTGTEEGQRYFVSEITLVSATTIQVVISDFFNNPVVRFDVPVTAPKFTQYAPAVKYVEEFGGRFVVGEVAEMIVLLDQFPMAFSGISSELEPSVCQISDQDLRVTSASPIGATPVLRGDVKFEGEDGIQVTQDLAENKIVIGFEDPVTPSLCDCPPNFPEVKRINGVNADCDGNFNICAEGILFIEQKPDGICINSIIDPNQICDIGTGPPGPPGPPGVGIPGPPGPPGPPLNLECNSQCIEAAIGGICQADFAQIVVCNALTASGLMGPTLDCDPGDPYGLPPTPADIELRTPWVMFGQLLLQSKIIKRLIDFVDNFNEQIVTASILYDCNTGSVPPCDADSISIVRCPQDITVYEVIADELGQLIYNMALPAVTFGQMLLNSAVIRDIREEAFPIQIACAPVGTVPPNAADDVNMLRCSQTSIEFDPVTLTPSNGCTPANKRYELEFPAYSFGDLIDNSVKLFNAVSQCFTELEFKIVVNGDPTTGVNFDLSNIIPGNMVTLDPTALVGGGGDLLATNNLSDVASASTSRTNLGLGTLAIQNATGVSITGGSVTGITDLAIADGGTGASTASDALNNLGGQPKMPFINSDILIGAVLDDTNMNKSLRVDGTGAPGNITLPTSAQLNNGDQVFFVLIFDDAGAGAVTIVPGAGTSIVTPGTTDLGEYVGSFQSYRYDSFTTTWYSTGAG